MPLVSVIIPTFDRPEFLRRALRSVLRQTVEDFEALVIDDGSVTGLLPLIEGLADGRIRYFRHESNRGEAAARNTGIRNANGAYLAFLDDDDEWLPEKLGQQLELFSRCPDTVGCVYGGYVTIRGSDGQVLSRFVPTKRGDLARSLLQKNIVGIPSTVVLRRQCLERAGPFDEGIAFGVDYDLWRRVAQDYHFDFVTDVVARYTVHERQLSRNALIRVKGYADLRRKYGSRLPPSRWREGKTYFELGQEMCLLGNSVEARRAFLKALRINPLHARAYVYCLALSLGGPRSVARLRALVGKVRGGDSAG